jgi:hypothetical protein
LALGKNSSASLGSHVFSSGALTISHASIERDVTFGEALITHAYIINAQGLSSAFLAGSHSIDLGVAGRRVFIIT